MSDLMQPLSFGSLFAGIGGFDLGFERAGMVCKWQVEIDDYANRVLAKHWPNVHRERDVREVGRHNLESVDVICGGFPCQDISYAGLGAGLDGDRSGLFFEAVRVVRELRPRFVVLENVAALLTRGLDRVLGTLAEIGYDAEWHCITAASVGAPHQRDRVFVIANAYIFDGNDGRYGSGTIQWQRQETTDIPRCSDVANATRIMRNRGRSRTEQTRRSEPANCGWWDVEPAMGRVADGVPNRVHRLRGLGNAVVPQVAEWIGRTIVEAAGRTPAMSSDAARQDAGGKNIG
jgi:DNA (cytosine-5)-methyltransferase 1